jgi:hypothetical protein
MMLTLAFLHVSLASTRQMAHHPAHFLQILYPPTQHLVPHRSDPSLRRRFPQRLAPYTLPAVRSSEESSM